MQRDILAEELFQGAVSVERRGNGLKPWRIPYRDACLYVPDAINGKAEIPAGVRLAFASPTRSVAIEIEAADRETQLDCVVDGILLQKGSIPAGETQAVFSGLPEAVKTVEICLSQKVPVCVTAVKIDEDEAFAPITENRPHWVAYGSSITQCADAESPSQTWPALAARGLGMQLTCLGFGGNCHLEPMVARMIRELPADFISVCAGINIMGGSTLSARTFAPALIGFLQIVREKHPETPILVISPIYSRPRETTENKVGFTLPLMRTEIADVVQRLQDHGDRNLYYLDGLQLFGPEYADYLPDELHPNAEGYRIMASRFQELIPAAILAPFRC